MCILLFALSDFSFVDFPSVLLMILLVEFFDL